MTIIEDGFDCIESINQITVNCSTSTGKKIDIILSVLNPQEAELELNKEIHEEIRNNQVISDLKKKAIIKFDFNDCVVKLRN